VREKKGKMGSGYKGEYEIMMREGKRFQKVL